MKKSINDLLLELENAPKKDLSIHAMFYKTAKGDYAEHDRFRGIANPVLRKISARYNHLHFIDIETLLKSPFNENRLIALFILVAQYQKGNAATKRGIFNFYIKNLTFINNWNLVDASAHFIVGDYLYHNDQSSLLIDFTKSPHLWTKRIAIVATWFFIKNNQCDLTLKIVKILLNDTHDLIQKASGWMLREVGKKNKDILVDFLNQNLSHMPRVTLRYAIERFSESERQFYLKKLR
jgi:3-methyladenine DNA glycosylase AlkD